MPVAHTEADVGKHTRCPRSREFHAADFTHKRCLKIYQPTGAVEDDLFCTDWTRVMWTESSGVVADGHFHVSPLGLTHTTPEPYQGTYVLGFNMVENVHDLRFTRTGHTWRAGAWPQLDASWEYVSVLTCHCLRAN